MIEIYYYNHLIEHSPEKSRREPQHSHNQIALQDVQLDSRHAVDSSATFKWPSGQFSLRKAVRVELSHPVEISAKVKPPLSCTQMTL